MLDEYYELRGWDCETGLQKKGGLEEMGLGHVVEGLAARGLVKT
jgi:hypothetical protein